MKTCLFCREQVHDDSIKCRYCQSSFLPTQPPEATKASSGQVTYILDRDLVRFGKFTAAMLAVFLVVGSYLFGFKLESSLEKVRATQQDASAAQEKLAIAQKDLEAAEATVRSLKNEVESALAEAKNDLAEISAQRDNAIALVVSIRELSPVQAETLSKIKAEKQEKVSSKITAKYWASGATIRIRFLDGDAISRETVKRIAQEWTKYANLNFVFTDVAESEVRVSFGQRGSWSFLGTDALAVAKDQPTVNLQWVDQRRILHEFGHVLGLIEEHQNPRANIKWDKARIYNFLGGAPSFWPKDLVDRNVFFKVPAESLGNYRAFDPNSVMTMSFPKEFTGGMELKGNDSLSESDKSLVARLYPGRNQI